MMAKTFEEGWDQRNSKYAVIFAQLVCSNSPPTKHAHSREAIIFPPPFNSLLGLVNLVVWFNPQTCCSRMSRAWAWLKLACVPGNGYVSLPDAPEGVGGWEATVDPKDETDDIRPKLAVEKHVLESGELWSDTYSISKLIKAAKKDVVLDMGDRLVAIQEGMASFKSDVRELTAMVHKSAGYTEDMRSSMSTPKTLREGSSPTRLREASLSTETPTTSL
mmetsp:Transcript_36894/g.73605  ORF Transcript_36894/g.73605 Transcript_36894/m.73605 type:complete len:219 (-) Transcript_36894:582-1238(-)